MEASIPPSRPDVVVAPSMPRPTASPPRIRFAEVLSRGAGELLRGAESTLRGLPGGPLMAVAVRGGSTSSSLAGHANAVSLSPEGPTGTSSTALGTGAVSGSGGADAGVESALAQSQEMNMYFLQIQEQVNAQNRSYSALSNVLKAEHDTVKTAIGNIR